MRSFISNKEGIREGPVIIASQQGNLHETDQEKLTEIYIIYQQQAGMYNK